MNPIVVKAFLSCSRDPVDTVVVQMVKAVCEGLSIQCYTVDGAPDTALAAAQEEIRERPLLIAVATRRKKLGKDLYQMPDAVAQEVNMATALGKNVALLVEDRVDDQAMPRAAELKFTRNKLSDTEFVKKLVSLLHRAKLRCIQRHQLLQERETGDFFVMESHILRRLVAVGNGYTWNYVTSRKVVFQRDCRKPLDISIWPSVDASPSPKESPLDCNASVVGGNKRFKITFEKSKHTASIISGRLRVSPSPKSGDSLKYMFDATSRYFAPIYKVLSSKPHLEIDGKAYYAFSGSVFTRYVSRCVMKYVFPRCYGLPEDAICAFAGVYTTRITEVIQSEARRVTTRVENFGGEIHVTLEVYEPLVGYAYGLAWNPSCKGKSAHFKDR